MKQNEDNPKSSWYVVKVGKQEHNKTDWELHFSF